MNTVEKAALLRNRDAIVQNVEFNYIKEKLVAYGVLSVQEVQDVDCEVCSISSNIGFANCDYVLTSQPYFTQKTKSAKVRRLLDLLPEIGVKETFTTFVKILEEDYDWIAERLSECNNRDSPDAASHLNSDPFAAPDSLQHSLIQCGIPFPPPHLIPRHTKVCLTFSKSRVQQLIGVLINDRSLRSENVLKQ